MRRKRIAPVAVAIFGLLVSLPAAGEAHNGNATTAGAMQAPGQQAPSNTEPPVITATATSNLIFDGRATQLASLNCSAAGCGQTPDIWDGLQFCNEDITLASDSRFGQVYHYRLDSSSNLAPCQTIWGTGIEYASLN